MAHPSSPTRTAPAEVIPVEQAVYRRRAGEDPALLARSPGFLDRWLPAVEGLVTGFGERPPGVACPAAVFARPLEEHAVAIAQVADLPDERAADPPLGFHVLVLPRAAYARYLGDPFAVADRFPPSWSPAGPLEALALPAEPQPPRTVADVQAVLQRVKAHALREGEDPQTEEGSWERTVAQAESPALLGGVQVLVDGGKVVFERPAPDTGLIRGLWTLLPGGVRGKLWPASFAFDNALGFDALVVPEAVGEEYAGYTDERQAAEYPQGYYELRLQTAAEAGDQQELDSLFNRRSSSDTLRLGLALLAVLAVGVLFLRLTAPPQAPPAPKRPSLTPGDRAGRAAVAVAVVSSGSPLAALNLLQIAQNPEPIERAGRAGLAASVISAGDPLSALNLLHIGNKKWARSGKEAP
jgi:hypothetical protein